MEHKVLIADDSLTIQKVIKITLANEPFELSECANPDELASVVREASPEIVLLDFNLSENKTGYDLCREIKQINPKIGVLMLFGTFDTIDEELLLECGCNYHIVKPFDGSKFINLCRALAQDFQSAPSDGEEEGLDIDDVLAQKSAEQEEPASKGDFGEDDWVMNQPRLEEPAEEDELSAPQFEQNDLAKEVEEWGMEVPSVIGAQQSGAPEVPDVIGEEEADLPGPIEGSVEENQEASPIEVPTEDEEIGGPEGIELQELEEDEGIEIETFEPEESYGTETEEELERIKSQIEEEPEEEELWAADVVESDSEPEEFSAMDTDSFDHIEEETIEEEAPEDFPDAIGVDEGPFSKPGPAPEAQSGDSNTESMAASAIAASEEISEKIQEELEAQLGAKLSPLVEKCVKDYCREQIERVAWEVIPDLAENIIKKEIQKISDSIMDQ